MSDASWKNPLCMRHYIFWHEFYLRRKISFSNVCVKKLSPIKQKLKKNLTYHLSPVMCHLPCLAFMLVKTLFVLKPIERPLTEALLPRQLDGTTDNNRQTFWRIDSISLGAHWVKKYITCHFKTKEFPQTGSMDCVCECSIHNANCVHGTALH